MIINSSNNCGNSPKNKFIEDYSIFLLDKDIEQLRTLSFDPISITLPNGMEINDLNELNTWRLEADTVTCISSISHGKQVSFLALIEYNNIRFYISIYYEFKTLRAEKVSKVVIVKGESSPITGIK